MMLLVNLLSVAVTAVDNKDLLKFAKCAADCNMTLKRCLHGCKARMSLVVKGETACQRMFYTCFMECKKLMLPEVLIH